MFIEPLKLNMIEEELLEYEGIKINQQYDHHL